jgi:hypothetical protein
MSTVPPSKTPAPTVAEICQRFPLGDESKKLLRDGLKPRAFLDLLIEKQQYLDAIRFLAHVLPRREGVWWACQCARSAAGPNPAAPYAAAVAAAEKWVADPSEANRRAAHAASEAAGLETPAGCAAMAAFWSGGSLGPPNVPVIPPAETLTAHGVGGAVMLAAVVREPEKAAEKHRTFLALGIEVANGTNRWK